MLLEDRVVPSMSLGDFAAVNQYGSLVYQASGGGLLGETTFTEGFESEELGGNWKTYSMMDAGRVRLTGEYGTAAGAQALMMDTAAEGEFNLNEATVHIQQAATPRLLLQFAHAAFGDEPEGFGVASYTGHYFADGVSVSNDGLTWHPVWDPFSSAGGLFPPAGVWTNETVDLTAAAAAGGYTLNTSDFYIRFQQFDNFPLTTDGRGYDEISLLKPGIADVLPLTLDPGQRITVVVEGDDGVQVNAQLLAGTQGNHVLASATAAAPGGTAVLPSVAIGGNLTAYNPRLENVRLQVGGVNGNLGTYTVTVYLNAALENESYLPGANNNEFAGAQSLENAFLQLNRNGHANSNGAQPARAAVLGTTDVSQASGIVDEIEVNHPDTPDLPNPLDYAQDIDAGNWIYGKDNIFTDIDTSLLTVVGTGDGTFDYYKFTIETGFSGVSISIVSDFLDATGGFAGAFVVMFDANGQFVDYTGDEFFSPIDLSLHDAGVYYIGVGTWYSGFASGILFGDTPPVDSNYELTFSIIDHPATEDGSGVLLEVEPNDFDNILPPVDLTQYAQNLDGETWVVNNDPFIPEAATIPHITVNATGDGSFDYYLVTIPEDGAFVQFGMIESTVLAGGGVMAAAIWTSSDGLSGSFYSNVEFGFGDFFEAGTIVFAVGTYESAFLNNGQLVGTAPQDGETYSFFVSVSGHEFDEPSGDVYSFRMKKGESTAISLTSLTGQSPMNVELRKADGTVLATGTSTVTNVGSALSHFVAPVSGTYYVVVTSPHVGTAYNLVVNRNVAMDLEGNNSFAAAQPVLSNQVEGRKWVTGAIESTVSLAAFDSGWYDSTGFHSSANDNYLVGFFDPNEYRNFFVFDRSTIEGTILSATFSAFNPTSGFSSLDASETYSLFDVTTPIAALRAGGSGQFATFADLGTGTVFGSRSISNANQGQSVDVTLNASALAALNATSGHYAIGGALTSIDGIDPQYLFGFTNGSLARTLNVTAREGDLFQIEADARAMLQFETMTPGGGSGQFANVFDPYLALYDAEGNLVASNDNGASDGRNAELSYHVPKGKGGTYYIKVMSSMSSGWPTSGEYVLSIKGDRVGHGNDDHGGQGNGQKTVGWKSLEGIYFAGATAALDIHGTVVESAGIALAETTEAETVAKRIHVVGTNPHLPAARIATLRTPLSMENPMDITSPFEFGVFVG
jgi:hypothetical protein